jgi:hypothetical protein
MTDPTQEKYNPVLYANYPVLDQILLNYLGIEELVDRWKVDPTVFELQSSLNLLTGRFHLAPVTSFRAFLRAYDSTYATVRSYFLIGAKPEEIMFQAAVAGNLQAFYTGLKLYPKYRASWFLNIALRHAARGGHKIMIDLVHDLGGCRKLEQLRGTIEGGHLATLEHLDTVYVHSIPIDWTYLLDEAGMSGNQAVIDFVIDKGGREDTSLIQSLIINNHIELALKYIRENDYNQNMVFRTAMDNGNLDLARLVAADNKINREVLNQLLNDGSEYITEEIIDYFISLGADDYNALLYRLAGCDNLKLFKKYSKGPGVDYESHLINALYYDSIKVVKYIIKNQLVDLAPDKLNSYLSEVSSGSLELIDLLISLGATPIVG